MTNVEKALELVRPGMTIGLGSGHAAERFVHALGERVKAGLKVRGVPTSVATGELARQVGIPVVDLRPPLPLDLTIDGADEVDPKLNLIKGYGHALVREKVVAAASRRLVILIGPEHVQEKLVVRLGTRGKLPVEVLPFAISFCSHRIASYDYPNRILTDASGKPVVTDNGNNILEVTIPQMYAPSGLDGFLNTMPGVVGTGFFLGMAHTILIEDGGELTVRERPPDE